MNLTDPLMTALHILGNTKGHYRVVVVNGGGKVHGLIIGRRLLEILLGRRGSSIRAKKGFESVLQEPVNLFMDESYQIFPENTDAETVIKYMVENSLGYVILVDQAGAYKGIIEESCILSRLRGKRFGLRTRNIMSKNVRTIDPEATIRNAAQTMIDNMVRRLPVTLKSTIVGIVTASDIIRHIILQEGKTGKLGLLDVARILDEGVANVMSQNVHSIQPDSDAGEALDKMVNLDVSGLPVVSKEGQLFGIVSRVDFIKIAKLKGVSTIVEMMT